jgi:hypothetical protein
MIVAHPKKSCLVLLRNEGGLLIGGLTFATKISALPDSSVARFAPRSAYVPMSEAVNLMNKYTQSPLALTDQLRSALLDRLDAPTPATAKNINSGLNRRMHSRFQFRNSVNLELLNSDGKVERWTVFTRNLSAGGLSFLYHAALQPGALCQIKLPNLDGSAAKVCGTARVARLVAPGVFEVGLQFDQAIDPEQFVRVDDAIRLTG